MRFDRRRVLRLSGTAAALGATGLAGCTGDDGEPGTDGDEGTPDSDGTVDDDAGEGTEEMDGEGETEDVSYDADADLSGTGTVPDYTEWIATDETGEAFYAFTSLREAQGQLEQTGDNMDAELRADPMWNLPAGGAVAGSFALLGLSSYGLSGLVQDARGGDQTESNPTGAILTNSAAVVAGDMRADAIESRLQAEPETEAGTQYEAVDSISVFTVYEPVDGTDDAIAVGVDGIVFPNGEVDDVMATIRTPIEAFRGETQRATDEHEAFAWLTATGGDGDAVIGVYAENLDDASDGAGGQEYPALADATGIVTSLTPEFGADEVTGSFAATIAEPDQTAVARLLGASADERSVMFDGGRTAATATWQDP